MSTCLDCDGQGVTRSEDWDEYGSHIVDVTCEACQGEGELGECRECREPAPLPELDRLGICLACSSQASAVELANKLLELGRRVA